MDERKEKAVNSLNSVKFALEALMEYNSNSSYIKKKRFYKTLDNFSICLGLIVLLLVIFLMCAMSYETRIIK